MFFIERFVATEYQNIPYPHLQIHKVDSETGEPLEGVRFQLSDAQGRELGRYATNGQGQIHLTGMEQGGYYLREIETLEGYVLDGTVREVNLLWGKTTKLEIPNTPLGALRILKTDSETKQPLSGAVFQLYDEKGNPLGSYTTDGTGMIELSRKLTPGKYWVKETKAPAGYVLDPTPRKVEIREGETAELEVPNLPLCTLRILKLDSETKQPLYGVQFHLYDGKGNLLGEFTTDNNGKIELPRKLMAGSYVLKETKAASGYVLDEIPKTLVLKPGETLELEIPNKPMGGQIQIVKKSADDNPVTREKAGTPLEGAVFELYNQRLEVVDTITTDSRGMALSRELPMGTYGVKEVSAPDYYLTDGRVFYAELKVDGDLVRFEVLNQSAQVNVTVEKRGNAEVLAGDAMAYDFSEIRNDSNVSLEEFFWHDQLPTDAVRLGQIVTGTWSERLTYSVTYRINQRSRYRPLAENLSSKASHTLDCSGEALNLAANEYITDIRFEFGTVGPDFHQEESPVFYVNTLAELEDGYRIINRTDVGGRIGEEWVVAKDTWVTVVWDRPKGKLPNTGIN